jgi:chromosome segregation ATPase
LSKTEIEEKKTVSLAKQLLATVEANTVSLQLVIRQRQRLEEDLEGIYLNHTNVNKSVESLLVEQNKTFSQVHLKENEAFQLINDIANIKMEILKLQNQLTLLSSEDSNNSIALKEKETLLSKYQLDIKQRNDEIEKKMLRVDRLSKRYEKMIESAGGVENLGSVENTLKSLVDQDEALQSSCTSIERSWLSLQTEMVEVLNDFDEKSIKKSDILSRISLLAEQRSRLELNQNQQMDDMKEIEFRSLDLRKETLILNSLMSNAIENAKILENTNFSMETTFVDEFKLIANENSNLKDSIIRLKDSRAQLLDKETELENQILLWNQKLQLDKELKDALNPLMGQLDIQRIEKDINRMINRRDAIKKQQKTLSNSIETTILKKTDIFSKVSNNKNASKLSSNGGIQKSLNGLHREINNTEDRINRKQLEKSQHEMQKLEIGMHVQNLNDEFQCYEHELTVKQNTLKNKMFCKQLLLDQYQLYQSFYEKSKTFEPTDLSCKVLDTFEFLVSKSFN